MPLYTVGNGTTGAPSDLDQIVDAFTANNDVGTVSLYQQIPPPGAPNVAVNSLSGNLNGQYMYAVAFLTGYWRGQVGAGTIHIQGNTGGGTPSATVSPASQQVDITSIPIGGTGVVARVLYRTKANGSTFYFLQQINDNVTTSWTDNVPDTSLGTQMPTVNTTGTTLQLQSKQLAVTDTGLVNNLHAQIADDLNVGGTFVPAQNFARTDQANTFTANQTAPQWVSNAPPGMPPLWVTSPAMVANLNADMVDGLHASAFVNILSTSKTIYVDPVNGDDSNPGTQQQPFRTIQAAVNSLPKVLSAAATIQLAAGTYNETVNITAFLGMTITLLGNTSNPSSVVLNGSIWVYECGKVSIKGITIQNFSMLAVYNESSIVEVSKCVINGSALSDSNTRTGISSNFGARTRVLNTSFSSFGASSVTLRGCIYGGYSSQISVYTCQFTDVDVAFAVDASIIHGFSGTFTFSSVTTQTLAKNGGQIWEIP